jgi:CheY-like chemotaxis protein
METGSSSLRIFVVENHLDSLRALQGYLEQMGHKVLTATTMTEALAALPGAGCDVLISDIGLADGSGWELMERLKLSGPIFAIAMSGYGMIEDRERSKAAGFRHHLVKPTDPDELDELLDQATVERATGKTPAP